MDEVLKAAAQGLLAQGPLGLIVIGMGWSLWKLHQQLTWVQEKRVNDALKLAEAAHTFASALERNTETMRTLLDLEG